VRAAATGPWAIDSVTHGVRSRPRRWRAPLVAAACIAAGLAAWGAQRQFTATRAEPPIVELDSVDTTSIAVRGTVTEDLVAATAPVLAPIALPATATVPANATLSTPSGAHTATPEVSSDLAQPPAVGVDTPVP